MFLAFVNTDEAIQCHGTLSDLDIVNEVSSDSEEDIDVLEGSLNEPTSNREALGALDTLRNSFTGSCTEELNVINFVQRAVENQVAVKQ